MDQRTSNSAVLPQPSAQPTAQAERVDYRRLAWVGPLTIVAAAVATAIAAFVLLAMGILPSTQPAFQPFSVGIGTAMQVLLGVIVFAVIGKFARRPIFIFRIVAWVVLVLSFLNPIMAGAGMMPGFEIDTMAVIGLIILHVVAGVLTIWLLTSQARARSGSFWLVYHTARVKGARNGAVGFISNGSSHALRLCLVEGTLATRSPAPAQGRDHTRSAALLAIARACAAITLRDR
jgi:hypothetical protein